jgi:hypothetical protein
MGRPEPRKTRVTPAVRFRRVEEALAHLRRAAVLDPRSVLTTQFEAYALVWLRRYPEALAAAERGLAVTPGDLGMIHAEVTACQGRPSPPDIRLYNVPPGHPLWRGARRHPRL